MFFGFKITSSVGVSKILMLGNSVIPIKKVRSVFFLQKKRFWKCFRITDTRKYLNNIRWRLYFDRKRKDRRLIDLNRTMQSTIYVLQWIEAVSLIEIDLFCFTHLLSLNGHLHASRWALDTGYSARKAPRNFHWEIRIKAWANVFTV